MHALMIQSFKNFRGQSGMKLASRCDPETLPHYSRFTKKDNDLRIHYKEGEGNFEAIFVVKTAQFYMPVG